MHVCVGGGGDLCEGEMRKNTESLGTHNLVHYCLGCVCVCVCV